MTAERFLDSALIVTFAILIMSFLLIILRIVRGPTLPDRILALDLLVAVVIGFIAALGIRTGFTVYVDIAIALGLVGFLSTVALARFVLRSGDLSIEERPALGRIVVEPASGERATGGTAPRGRSGEVRPMPDWVLYGAGALSLVGAFFVLVAAIGVLRLDDLYMRMHAASKAGTLGSGVLLMALAVFSRETDVVLRALAAFVFFLLTAPISAHLLARAAYTVGYRPCSSTKHDALAERLAAAASNDDSASSQG